MNVDRLVEQARELLDGGSLTVWEFSRIDPFEVLAGLADSVERLRDDNRRLRTEAVGLTEDGRTVPELESEVERLQRDNDLALRAMGEYWEERDAARARVAALEAIAIQAPCHCIGSGSTHDIPRVTYRCPRCELLDGRVPSTGQETT